MKLLGLLLDGYSLVLFASIILSWVRLPPDNPWVRVTHALTEPVLAPVRRILPNIPGIDFSPMVVLFLLRMFRRFLRF